MRSSVRTRALACAIAISAADVVTPALVGLDDGYMALHGAPAPSCGRDRAAAIADIAAPSHASYAVLVSDWDETFEIRRGLEAEGGVQAPSNKNRRTQNENPEPGTPNAEHRRRSFPRPL